MVKLIKGQNDLLITIPSLHQRMGLQEKPPTLTRYHHSRFFKKSLVDLLQRAFL